MAMNSSPLQVFLSNPNKTDEARRQHLDGTMKMKLVCQQLLLFVMEMKTASTEQAEEARTLFEADTLKGQFGGAVENQLGNLANYDNPRRH